MTLPYFDAVAVLETLTFARAMDAVEAALRNDVDPELDGPRLFSPAPDGEFLLMPAQGDRFSGLKALTVAPQNPARGLEKIQGLYILLDSGTLAPAAVMEGSSLTAIRTPAVAISAVRQLAALAPAGAAVPANPQILVFGAGTQGRGSILAARSVFPDATFDVVGRSAERVSQLRSELTSHGINIVDRGNDPESAVRAADIIVCATTASAPLFDGALVRDSAIVAAIGTHGRDLRELDDALIGRADIVVEGRASAERENGNLATAFTADDWITSPPPNLRDLATGAVTRRPGHPAVYTGVGMSWEDLVCATVVFTEGTPTR